MNRRLPLSTFVVCSALLLTGCAKTVSKEDAEKFIEENYTSTEEKEMKVHAETNVEKVEGIYALLFEVGKKSEDDTMKVAPITKADLVAYNADYFEYKVQGKKLIIEYNLKNAKDVLKSMGSGSDGVEEKDIDFKGSAYFKAIFDDKGYPVSESTKIDMSMSYTYSGVTVSGALKMTSEVTYTAK